MLFVRVIVEVVRDLWSYFVRGDFGSAVTTHSVADRMDPSPGSEAAPSVVRVRSQDLVLSAQLPAKAHQPETIPLHGTSVAWVVVVQARVFTRPVHTFDGVVSVLSYATEVQVERYEGRFAYIHIKGNRGWVLKDVLAFDATVLFPHLRSGERYDAHHEATVKIRTYLRDEFVAEELLLPLLPVEYVSYVLARTGRSIVWPGVRPRLVGSWHHLLRGLPGIHVGLSPRTGSLVEWQAVGDIEAYLAYTEAVHPDGVIVVAGVGRVVEGEFLREELAPEVYQAQRAVWITVG